MSDLVQQYGWQQPWIEAAQPAGSRVLFCDFDGPIADVSERYYATYRLGLSQLETEQAALGQPITLQPLSKAQFWTFKQNRVPDRQIAHWSGLTGTQIDQFLDQVKQRVNHPDLLRYDQPQPLAVRALQQLNSQAVRVVLVTLRPPNQVREFLHIHQLSWAISDLFGVEQADVAYANHASHKIDLLQAAMAHQLHQGYSLAGACMVGDTEADILAGQTADIPTLALTCGIRSRRYLRTFQPQQILPDLWAVAHHITHSSCLITEPA